MAHHLIVIPIHRAGVVELADTLDLGSSAARRGGSTPFTRTQNILQTPKSAEVVQW